AYRLSESSRGTTVLRGGVGLFYDIGFGQLGDVFANNAQYYGSRTFVGTAGFPFTPEQLTPPGLGSTATPIARMAVFDPQLKLPRTTHWNVTLEQQLGFAQTLSASYVGAAGRRLLQQNSYSRPNPSFDALLVTRNGATSDYSGLQIQ